MRQIDRFFSRVQIDSPNILVHANTLQVTIQQHAKALLLTSLDVVRIT